MTQSIHPERLKQLRNERNLTRKDLAEKAGLSEQTVFRLERGTQSGKRNGTVERLCKALGITPDMLSGQTFLQGGDGSASEHRTDGSHQINARVDGAIRNAYSLVSRRYGVDIATIVQYAPLLFFLAAEESLSHRREQLRQWEALLNRCDELAKSAPHLEPFIYSESVSYQVPDGIELENESINARDIFSRRFSNRQNPIYSNVFDRYLRDLVREVDSSASMASNRGVGGPRYRICRDEAVTLVGDEEEPVNAILDGAAPLHELPDDLRDDCEPSARAGWARERLRQSQEETRRWLDDLLEPADHKDDIEG